MFFEHIVVCFDVKLIGLYHANNATGEGWKNGIQPRSILQLRHCKFLKLIALLYSNNTYHKTLTIRCSDSWIAYILISEYYSD